MVVATRHGLMCASRMDAYVGRSLIEYGEFSPREFATMARYLRPGDLALDIGANIGALTIPLAHHVGPTGVVIALEPQRICFQAICANAALGSLTNIVAINAAVGAEAGSIAVPLLDPAKPANFGALELDKGHPGQPVEVLRLDDLPGANLVKIDVEGMEPEVLKGGTAYLAEHRPVLYVESDRGNRRDELMGLLDAADYDCFWDRPPLYVPDNFRGNPHNLFPNIVSENLLCLPRGGPWGPPEGLEAA